MIQNLRALLAPTGRLRVGINMANFLLVTGQRPDGTPDGVSPDLARWIAAKLDVPCDFIRFDNPGQLADCVNEDIWDIGNIAVEPARAKHIAFTRPYVQIDANFMVRQSDPYIQNADIDQPDTSIAAYGRSAYELWLTSNFANADIIRTSTIAESHELFKAGDANVLASLKSKLLDEIAANSDYRIIEPPFTSVLQACGVAKTKQTAVAFLNTVIGELIANGGLENSLDQHDVAAELSLSRVQAV
ncbi:transporter substrate-binding domain-containing protein [Alphaproteobacteria bacterium]|jgi:polar amino acid transport system substrate-binding protein|nr:transporter substrate-binding domain-containing protein [Alphaproteobacteria bacterium]MDA8943301.1 transporter substrate-binding domain-containing protein [Alphaproteobacteria bacterium]MDA9013649.1 transporter substrate-binding domain-containing protein [Alphaproteobacteria bacterium]MDG2490678.1 transporter substrate-binding domain-containing protein [Alphaproteobacteria bacterium]